jgi:hypothetical protein
MESGLRIASCSCGGLEATCLGEPKRVGICNCTECQKRTGSVFGVGAYYSKSNVQLRGKTTTFNRSSESGRTLSYQFCPTCGSTVIWELELFPDLVAVAVGCFTDPTFPAPKRAVWGQYKHGWVQFPEDVETLPSQPG